MHRLLPNYFIYRFSGLLLCIGLGLFAVARVALGDANCQIEDVPLEVGIGTITSIAGLTKYIKAVYEFIIASIGVVAVGVIVYHGLRWAVAAGNEEVIGKAKEGIVSAVIGVTLALTSYVILFAVNESFVALPDICPTGLSGLGIASWDQCETAVTKNSTECATSDYCTAPDGCACQPIKSGSKVLACIPLGDKALPAGTRCRTDENCASTPKLYCISGSLTQPGTCEDVKKGYPCVADSECGNSALQCVDTGVDKQCMLIQGRQYHEYCKDGGDNVCTSGICASAFPNYCISGEEGTECFSDDALESDETDRDDDCLSGLVCSGNKCIKKVVTDECDEEGGCPDGLTCVENDGNAFDSTCQDGSAGSDCDSDADCGDGNYCQDNSECHDASTDAGFCRSDFSCPGDMYCFQYATNNTCFNGDTRDPCQVIDEEAGTYSCATGYYCVEFVTSGISTNPQCYDGSVGAYCDDGSDCASGTCDAHLCK